MTFSPNWSASRPSALGRLNRNTGPSPGSQGSFEHWYARAKKNAARGEDTTIPNQFKGRLFSEQEMLDPNSIANKQMVSYRDFIGSQGAGGGLGRLYGIAGQERDEQAAYQKAQYGAQAAGAEEQVSGFEDILAEATKYGNDINALWKGVENTLQKHADNAKAAIEAGYDPETVKAGYEQARGQIENAIDQVTGIYQDLGSEIDTEMERAPYDERKSLSLMKETLMRPLNEHLKATQDYLQRTGSQGSSMPRSRDMLQTAMKEMVPYVGQEIQNVADRRAGMLGQKQNLGQWYGGQYSGLRGKMADLHTGEADRLSDLSRWKGENLAGIERGLAGQKLSATQGQAGALGQAYTAKAGAMEGLTGAKAGLKTAQGMAKASEILPTDYSAIKQFTASNYGGNSTRNKGITRSLGGINDNTSAGKQQIARLQKIGELAGINLGPTGRVTGAQIRPKKP